MTRILRGDDMFIRLSRADIELICDGLVILEPDDPECSDRRDDLIDFLGPCVRPAYSAPATNRPGDQAWVDHEETGIDYATCLRTNNMD